MHSLFKPGAKINQDHKHKYIHILAYAASVVETWKKVGGHHEVLASERGRFCMGEVSLLNLGPFQVDVREP